MNELSEKWPPPNIQTQSASWNPWRRPGTLSPSCRPIGMTHPRSLVPLEEDLFAANQSVDFWLDHSGRIAQAIHLAIFGDREES